ncbi:hypothetical protein BVG16_12670 [Paenibacillus selenitireducens]|uniref:Uncharacterized protein n=1 Tax=Paenibacillus selenitireducens TaxID=1324314 RepID=A0A1T2XGF1_9BACL|nr:hypothetical protein [Paenibacillus selenitireducens]OPA78703.1 hypothetical protein BVG16_12670 [Paenibacillus selenitireducens]
MKRFTLLVITLVFTILVIVILIIYYPKEININAQGIKYGYGTEIVESEKLVNVQIEGKLYKSITGKRKFEGTIDIEGEELPVPLDQRKLTILISDEGAGVINYPYFTYRKDNGATNGSHTYYYGTLVINRNFTNATIFVGNHSEIKDNRGTAWNSVSGQVITVPSSSRAEAIHITNELAGNYLRGLKLK